MSSSTFNIGVLGAGQIAQAAHFPAVRKAKTAALYAICDAADDLRMRMAAVHQPTTTFADYDAMLADDNVDAVIVAVADQFHVPLSIKALEAGKHVLVEKPMATTIEDAEALAEAARTSDRVVLVGHEKRYDPGVAFAHDFIRDEIGELIGLKHWYTDSTYRYSVTDTLQPIIETSAAARRPPGNPKADRRRYLVLGHGSHMLDTARYLGGPLEAIRARLSTKADTYCWFLEVAYTSGCLGQLDLTQQAVAALGSGHRVSLDFRSSVATGITKSKPLVAEMGQIAVPILADLGDAERAAISDFLAVIQELKERQPFDFEEDDAET